MSPRREASLRLVTVLMAATAGFGVANIYYAQPLLDLIAHDFRVGHEAAALVVTLTQAGYAIGILLLTPLGDMVQTRRLASITLVFTAAALAFACLAPTYGVFLGASVLVGVTAVVVQVIVPFSAQLAPEGRGGRMVGRVVAGLLLGILLARTLSSVVASISGWRTVFGVSGVIMIILAVAIWFLLPARDPVDPPRYPELLASMGRLVREEPTLRRRAITQAMMFGAFTAFWTCIAFELIHQFGFGQLAIGAFALVGAAGAAVAPIAGAIADRGRAHLGSGGALALAVIAMLVATLGSGNVIVLAVAAILLDFAVQSHQVFGQHVIYGLRPSARSRVNTVYMFGLFAGGTVASGIAGVLYEAVGWTGVCLFGAALPAAGLVVWVVHHVRILREHGRAHGSPELG